MPARSKMGVNKQLEHSNELRVSEDLQTDIEEFNLPEMEHTKQESHSPTLNNYFEHEHNPQHNDSICFKYALDNNSLNNNNCDHQLLCQSTNDSIKIGNYSNIYSRPEKDHNIKEEQVQNTHNYTTSLDKKNPLNNIDNNNNKYIKNNDKFNNVISQFDKEKHGKNTSIGNVDEQSNTKSVCKSNVSETKSYGYHRLNSMTINNQIHSNSGNAEKQELYGELNNTDNVETASTSPTVSYGNQVGEDPRQIDLQKSTPLEDPLLSRYTYVQRLNRSKMQNYSAVSRKSNSSVVSQYIFRKQADKSFLYKVEPDNTRTLVLQASMEKNRHYIHLVNNALGDFDKDDNKKDTKVKERVREFQPMRKVSMTHGNLIKELKSVNNCNNNYSSNQEFSCKNGTSNSNNDNEESKHHTRNYHSIPKHFKTVNLKNYNMDSNVCKYGEPNSCRAEDIVGYMESSGGSCRYFVNNKLRIWSNGYINYFLKESPFCASRQASRLNILSMTYGLRTPIILDKYYGSTYTNPNSLHNWFNSRIMSSFSDKNLIKLPYKIDKNVEVDVNFDSEFIHFKRIDKNTVKISSCPNYSQIDLFNAVLMMETFDVII